LQIGKDTLLIVTSIAHGLFSFINIDDPERPSIPKIKGYRKLFVISGCDTNFKSELRRNG